MSCVEGFGVIACDRSGFVGVSVSVDVVVGKLSIVISQLSAGSNLPSLHICVMS